MVNLQRIEKDSIKQDGEHINVMLPVSKQHWIWILSKWSLYLIHFFKKVLFVSR